MLLRRLAAGEEGLSKVVGFIGVKREEDGYLSRKEVCLLKEDGECGGRGEYGRGWGYYSRVLGS